MKPTDTVNLNNGGSFEDELLAIARGEDIINVVNKEYREIIELFGIEIALKLYQHYRGCRIDCPKYFYNMDFVIKVAAQMADKREREKLSILCGYTASWIEAKVREYYSQQPGLEV